MKGPNLPFDQHLRSSNYKVCPCIEPLNHGLQMIGVMSTPNVNTKDTTISIINFLLNFLRLIRL